MTYSKILSRMTHDVVNATHQACSVHAADDNTYIVYVGTYSSPKLTQPEVISMLSMIKTCALMSQSINTKEPFRD
jgi:hypothetical protein